MTFAVDNHENHSVRSQDRYPDCLNLELITVVALN